MDLLWVLFAAFLVFLMQAGFLCLESGLVRSKNSIHVAAKNITDFIVSSAIFWLFGFGLIFGSSFSGLIGTNNFFSSNLDASTTVFFIFQMMFCGTAATLVSGAIAERTHYLGYILITIVISLLIYPVIGHWSWAGILSGEATGWLEKLGFIDFAGSTVVHSVGGWVALAAILVVGARIGRFENGNNRIQGSNLPIAVLGCLLIWFGWFGFNGGSTLGWDESVPKILLNTILAAVWGGITIIVIQYLTKKYIDVFLVVNGVIGGLVSITANCNSVTASQAVLIGGIAGIIVFYGDRLLEKFKIDDAIGVIPAHLLAGIWGTLAVAFFADPIILGTGLSMWQQLGVQILGIISVGGYSFLAAYTLFRIINVFYPLRVSKEDELAGLNVVEHHVSTEVHDLLSTMQYQQEKADFSSRVPVEPFTEVGQIAQQYNRVIDKVSQEMKERDIAFHAFKKSEFRKGAILDAAMDCIVTINDKGHILEFNPAAEQCFGTLKKAVLSNNFFDLFILEKQKNEMLKNLEYGFILGGDGSLILKRQNVIKLLRAGGEGFTAEIVVTKTSERDQNNREYTLHIRDITKRIKLQNRLEALAYNDPLTGLFNRNYFITHLKNRIEYHKKVVGNIALMFLDLDQFKRVNDNLGHQAGDELLIEVASRLQATTRSNEDIVGRWGGDEFVILMSGTLDNLTIENKAKEILSSLRLPVQLPGQSIIVPTSIGIAISLPGEYNAEKLMQYADIAMYQAKHDGRNTYRIYSQEMSDRVQQHFEIERDLPEAISENQFELHLQPKVSCLTNEVIGFEALIRWHHPEHGFIMPDEFIPVIEESNLIIEVGEWVIENAIQQLAQWQKNGQAELPIAVNISGYHLHSPALVPLIESLLVEYGISSKLLEIEITEHVLTGDTKDSIAAMEALKKANIKLSIDDFGTGYSSLSYLKSFPIDILKIDRAFVRECHLNDDDAAICKAIITLAKSLGLQIIAEGVETQEQLSFLKEHHCDYYQGYYFSRPLPVSELLPMLEQMA